MGLGELLMFCSGSDIEGKSSLSKIAQMAVRYTPFVLGAVAFNAALNGNLKKTIYCGSIGIGMWAAEYGVRKYQSRKNTPSIWTNIIDD